MGGLLRGGGGVVVVPFEEKGMALSYAQYAVRLTPFAVLLLLFFSSQCSAIDFLKQVQHGETVQLLVSQEPRPGEVALRHTQL